VWLYLQYSQENLQKKGQGSTFEAISGDDLNEFEIPNIELDKQRQIAARLKAQLAEVVTARLAAQVQLLEIANLANAIVMDSVGNHPTMGYSLGDVLVEVKRGIGASWSSYPVLGATRDGLAPAKEAPGKQATKYKPVLPGTVFYNPMRILIGSIAFVDDDDETGITSPDYVVLQGRPEQIDSRWFYYWLRSPLGVACINSLARGAVRERMLFNRLAEGEIQLPDFSIQQRASIALKELKSLRQAINKQLREIDLLPQKILAQAFEN
jgi:type I restriction enzyme S subunit